MIAEGLSVMTVSRSPVTRLSVQVKHSFKHAHETHVGYGVTKYRL